MPDKTDQLLNSLRYALEYQGFNVTKIRKLQTVTTLVCTDNPLQIDFAMDIRVGEYLGESPARFDPLPSEKP